MGQAVPHGFIQSSEFAQWFSSNKVLIISWRKMTFSNVSERIWLLL
jgi:hypothetical protein